MSCLPKFVIWVVTSHYVTISVKAFLPFRTVQISHFFTAPLALTQSYIQNNSNSQLHKNLNQLVKEIILSKLTITPVPLHSGVLPLLPLHTTQSRRHSPHCKQYPVHCSGRGGTEPGAARLVPAGLGSKPAPGISWPGGKRRRRTELLRLTVQLIIGLISPSFFNGICGRGCLI